MGFCVLNKPLSQQSESTCDLVLPPMHALSLLAVHCFPMSREGGNVHHDREDCF